MSAPVLRLAQIWQDFHQARLSIARLGDILNTTAEPTYAAGRARLPAIRGNINFDHVSFRYRIDGPEVLHDVSFEVPAGQTVGIVGPSGSGKSTFAKLVQRLYVPERGRVLVDGMDLAMADPAWLRRQIGIVLQENVLFNLSVRDIVAHRDVEQHVLLQHDADLAAQPGRIGHGKVHAVDQHAPALRDVEALDQFCERALAGPGGPDDADRLAGRHLEADVLQDFRPVDAIAEGDMVELDVAADRRQPRAPGR